MAQTPKRYLSLKTGKIVKSKTAHSRAEILDYSKIKIGDRVRILIADDSAYSLKRYDDIQNRAIYGLNLDSGLEVIGLGKSWSHTPIPIFRFQDPSMGIGEFFEPYITGVFKL